MSGGDLKNATAHDLIDKYATAVLACERDTMHHIAPLRHSLERRSEAVKELMRRLTPAPSADDTEQIDDQVQDLVTVMVVKAVADCYGIRVAPESEWLREMYNRFRKDLASLGIRLTYDTTIGGGK